MIVSTLVYREKKKEKKRKEKGENIHGGRKINLKKIDLLKNKKEEKIHCILSFLIYKSTNFDRWAGFGPPTTKIPVASFNRRTEPITRKES